MKIVCLFLSLILIFTGCTTHRVQQTIMAKANLNGLSKQEILKRFGKPKRTYILPAEDSITIESWIYLYFPLDTLAPRKRTMQIIFSNDMVDKADYY